MALLFTVGPVEMFESTLNIRGRQVPYFRTPEFSSVVKESEALIKKFAGAPQDSRVALLTASGTGAMEAAVINCFTPADKLLVISGGGFGSRFEDICRIHGIPYTPIHLEFGEELTVDSLTEYNGKGYTGLLVNAHETTTGQLYDLQMISRFSKKNNILLVVDAISSFLADSIDVDKDSIDVLIFSSQKALALAPGISGIVLSARMLNRIKNIDPHSLYFDLKLHLKDMERGQTPFTPAVGVILEMHGMLKEIDAIGIDKKIEHTAEIAKDFRERVSGIGISVPAFRLSNCLTPILFKDGRATEIYETLKKDGIVLTPGGGKMKDSLLRVGHIGNHTIEDNKLLIEKLKEVI
ncbi:MAG: aminotransferase class V-fold PLP-dependent enzyme [Candidatus Methanoplasma sp.]|jgi:aspartate aminotransferase-like enzyme|nr:aminotransferase class V-fold PLP-dependent enzyme [Candidatus Methanoplasma sp.]